MSLFLNLELTENIESQGADHSPAHSVGGLTCVRPPVTSRHAVVDTVELTGDLTRRSGGCHGVAGTIELKRGNGARCRAADVNGAVVLDQLSRTSHQ